MLALDDYQVIEAPAIHQALTFLLKHLPPQVHLALTRRTNPPLPLARLRARGHLTELRTTDMQFNGDEAADSLNRVMPNSPASGARSTLLST